MNAHAAARTIALNVPPGATRESADHAAARVGDSSSTRDVAGYVSEKTARERKARALQTLRKVLPPDAFKAALRQEFKVELDRFVDAAISLRLTLAAFDWRVEGLSAIAVAGTAYSDALTALVHAIAGRSQTKHY
jgi:hypothetical protein